MSMYIVLKYIDFQNMYTLKNIYQKIFFHVLFCLFLKSSKAFNEPLM